MSKVTQLARGTVSHGSQICYFLHRCLRVTKNTHSKEDLFAERCVTVCALEHAGRGTTSHILAVDTADLPWGPSRTSQESLWTPRAGGSTNSWLASASFAVRYTHGCSNLCDEHCRFSHGTVFTQVFDYVFTSLSLFLMIKEILVFKLKTVLKLLG